MGASKKLMEELIMTYSSELPVKTARFANVAFSNGSLLFGFLERLNKNQAWSCPTGIKRFFVSSEESGQLCLIASILGETGDVFFPKLDPINDSIYFEAIARDLLKYLGLDIDICESEEEAKRKSDLLSASSKSHPVYFFKSDTSGEKLFEEFYTDKEVLDRDKYEALGIIKNSSKKDRLILNRALDDLENLLSEDKIVKTEIVGFMETHIPNFKHLETGKNLDSKM